MQASYFLGREVLVPAMAPKLPWWRLWLFLLMARNAVPATEFFRIPSRPGGRAGRAGGDLRAIGGTGKVRALPLKPRQRALPRMRGRMCVGSKLSG